MKILQKKNIRNKKRLINKIVISIVLILITIFIPIISRYVQTTIIVSYKEQSNIDYRVYLRQNDYYKTQYLEKNMHYIANLIDYIYVAFDYNFKTDESINYDYKYYIEAELTIFERTKSDNVIFKKKDILVEDMLESGTDTNVFNISKDIKINYDEYNNLVKLFKTDYNISADSNLKVTLYIEVGGSYEKFEYPIKANNLMEITIPLSEQMFNISTNYKEINNVEEPIIAGNFSNALLTISAIFGILAIVSIIRVFIFVYKIRSERSFYEKKKEKILKNYDRVIVELKHMIPIQNEERIIEVISFEELLDVSDRLSKPILLIELDKNKKSWFIVKNNEDIYRYILEETEPKLGE